MQIIIYAGARDGVVVRHSATSRKVTSSIPDEATRFSFDNGSSRAVFMGSAQPVTETSTRNLSDSKGRQVHRADNLTDIHQSIF
jgi:hypothetical protein